MMYISGGVAIGCTANLALSGFGAIMIGCTSGHHPALFLIALPTVNVVPAETTALHLYIIRTSFVSLMVINQNSLIVADA